MKYFLQYNHKKYSNIDLINTFYKLGIKKGDVLCVHTELFNFGFPLLSKNEFLQTLLECFFEVLGKEGTLIMPTFSYSFCKNEIYDKINSKSKVGILNEFFRKQIGVKRTNDPLFSFAIKGAKEELFLQDTTSCFGNNCVYEILINENGKYMLFGSADGHTLIHYVEEKYKVEYRYFKNFKGVLIDEQKNKHEKNINYYVRCLNKNPLPNLDNINHITKKSQNFQEQNFGGANISLFEAKEYEKSCKKALNKNKNIFIL